MSNLKASYQRIREELVALTVELEERSKVCDLLRNRLDEERYSVRNLDEDQRKDTELKLQGLVNAHREDMERLLKESSDLMSRKKELMEGCQQLVQQVDEAESELGETIRSIRDEGQTVLEKDKKAFKAGFEERKGKALSEKMGQVKEETRRAMEPEFQRLRRHHDTEMNDLLINLSREEKSLRDSYDKLLRDRMADEERAWKTSSQIRAREVLDTAGYELEALDASHKDEMRALTSQLKAELDEHKATLHTQLENEKNHLKSVLLRVKDENEKQLTDLRQSHRATIEQIHSDHEVAIDRIRARDQAARAAADRQHEADMRTASARMSQRDPSATASKGAAAAAASLDRDSRVQSEIRRLQMETVKLERALKVKVEHEKDAIEAAAERELAIIEKNCSRIESELAEVAAQKEALLAAIQKSNTERLALQEVRLNTESEISLLEDGIHEKEQQQEKRRQHDAALQQRALDAAIRAAEQSHQKFLSVQRLLTEKERMQQEEVREVEVKFESSLEVLDCNVKRDVEHYNREIEIIRDAVHTEKIKREKLKKILKSYAAKH